MHFFRFVVVFFMVLPVSGFSAPKRQSRSEQQERKCLKTTLDDDVTDDGSLSGLMASESQLPSFDLESRATPSPLLLPLDLSGAGDVSNVCPFRSAQVIFNQARSIFFSALDRHAELVKEFKKSELSELNDTYTNSVALFTCALNMSGPLALSKTDALKSWINKGTSNFKLAEISQAIEEKKSFIRAGVADYTMALDYFEEEWTEISVDRASIYLDRGRNYLVLSKYGEFTEDYQKLYILDLEKALLFGISLSAEKKINTYNYLVSHYYKLLDFNSEDTNFFKKTLEYLNEVLKLNVPNGIYHFSLEQRSKQLYMRAICGMKLFDLNLSSQGLSMARKDLLEIETLTVPLNPSLKQKVAETLQLVQDKMLDDYDRMAIRCSLSERECATLSQKLADLEDLGSLSEI